MNKDEKKETFNEKLAGYVDKRAKILIGVLVAIVVLFVAYCISFIVIQNNNKKGIESVDTIEFKLTDGSESLSDEEVEERKNVALESLNSFMKKGGVTGVRANMLAAEIYYSRKDYKNSAECYKLAAQKGKKSYTAPICNYYAAVSYENVGNLDEALAFYKKAAVFDTFVKSSHAKFSCARILESKGNLEEAKKVYQDLVDNNSGDTWADVAKTRLLYLDFSK